MGNEWLIQDKKAQEPPTAIAWDFLCPSFAKMALNQPVSREDGLLIFATHSSQVCAITADRTYVPTFTNLENSKHENSLPTLQLHKQLHQRIPAKALLSQMWKNVARSRGTRNSARSQYHNLKLIPQMTLNADKAGSAGVTRLDRVYPPLRYTTHAHYETLYSVIGSYSDALQTRLNAFLSPKSLETTLTHTAFFCYPSVILIQNNRKDASFQCESQRSVAVSVGLSKRSKSVSGLKSLSPAVAGSGLPIASLRDTAFSMSSVAPGNTLTAWPGISQMAKSLRAFMFYTAATFATALTPITSFWELIKKTWPIWPEKVEEEIMPKTLAEERKWRGVTGACWTYADKLNVLAEEVRYANKPADLTYPMHQLIIMASHISDVRGGWLEWYLGLDPKRRGRWPRV